MKYKVVKSDYKILHDMVFIDSVVVVNGVQTYLIRFSCLLFEPSLKTADVRIEPHPRYSIDISDIKEELDKEDIFFHVKDHLFYKLKDRLKEDDLKDYRLFLLPL